MRLERLYIEGFRAIREFDLDELPNLLAIVGPNGVGKSSVFQALGLLKDWVGSYGNSRSLPGRETVNASHSKAVISATFGLTEKERDWLRHRSKPIDSECSVSATLEIVDGPAVTEDSSGLRELFGHFDPGSMVGVVEHFAPYRRLTSDEISSMEVRFDMSHTRHDGPQVYSGRSDYNVLFRHLSELAFRDFLHYRATGESLDSVQPFTELFDRLLSPKKLVGPVVGDRSIYFEVETASGRHRLNQLSAGELEALTVFATLQRLETRQSVILYDSPEIHLHGTLERRILSEIQRIAERNQVILASHSYEIIAGTPVSSLVRIDEYNHRNQAVRLADEEEKLHTFEALGASVGIQLISTTVAFVEGQTRLSDARIYSALFPDLPESVSLVPAGSVTNVVDLAGRSTRLLDECSKYTRFFCIRDRDYLSDEDRQRQIELYSPSLIVLDRYHIENYLLEPAAIADARKRLGFPNMGKESIWNALEEAADQIRDDALVDWLRYQLNGALHSHKVKGGGLDPIEAYKDSARHCVRQITDLLAAERIEKIAEERRASLDAKWSDRVWAREFPGREILSRFAGSHCRGIDYRRFVSLLATCAADTGGETVDALRKQLSPLWL